MPKKKKNAAPVAGEHDSKFQVRLPASLRDRFKESCSVGGAGKVSQADAVRVLMEMRCDFTEKMSRQPSSLAELCEWYLKTIGKK